MGTVRSKIRTIDTINGILLGEPTIATTDGQAPADGTAITDLWFRWDDSALPDGELLADGTIIPDEVPNGM